MVFMAKNSSNILTATLFDVNWWENCSWNCQKMSFFFFFYSDLQIMALTYLLALLFSMRPSWKYIDLALFDVENLGREDLFELLYEAATWASVPNLSSKIFGKSYMQKWRKFRKFHEFFRVLIQDFTGTHILREINFGESRSCKTVGFVILGALKMINLVNFSLQKVQNF